MHRNWAISLRIAVVALTGVIVASGIGCGSGPATTRAAAQAASPAAPPTLATITPNSATSGGLAFTLDVRGSGFVPASTVQWNGNNRTTTFLSSGEIQAHIMAADLAAAGKVTVTVANSASNSGTSNGATFTIAANKIAFYSARALDQSDAANTNLTYNIWVVNPDGSGTKSLTKLTAAGTSNVIPVWSPDGSKMIFNSKRALDGSDASNTNGTANIWVMNADGSGVTPLTKLTANGIGSGGLAWSPDSTRIAFNSSRALDGSDAVNTNQTSNIWVMNADGSGVTPLTKLSATSTDTFAPVWSPDGSKIAFRSARALNGSDSANAGGVRNIWLMNADGSGAAPLTKLTTASSYFPAWSPDGSKIAFQSGRALNGSDAANTNLTANLWVMNADGSGAAPLTHLTASGADIINPLWSPSGARIVFFSGRALDGSDATNTANFVFNIWVINADGSGASPLTKLTAFASDSGNPVWSPDGAKVFFDSGRALNGSDNANTNSTENIWVVNADGSGAVPLTNLTANKAHSVAPNRP